MPLDPFFEERLRVHRKHLIDKARGAMRARLTTLWPLGRFAAPAAADVAPAASAAVRGGGDRPSLGPNARARARKRRAALAWDRSELAAVGTPGPDVRTTEHRVDVPGRPAVRIRVYHPAVPGSAAVPGVLAFFGGAFRIGGIDYPTTDASFRRRAVDAGVAIAAVDYALAPEQQYPA
ncbi:MAG: alpha/beta hydrolase fold domain-containing protein, partial [Microbacterium sp.]